MFLAGIAVGDGGATHRTIAANLTSVMLTVRAFRPKARADGAIVLVSSVPALHAIPHSDAYTASESAIVALAGTGRLTTAATAYGCVAPRSMDTDMMSGLREAYRIRLTQHRCFGGSVNP